MENEESNEAIKELEKTLKIFSRIQKKIKEMEEDEQ